ncbi:MAG TPA: efflux RND transporter permease subunit [Acidocella sp.]|uniref:efflux RND transporter permease subunit n=1 Tax=Acidocella sp. TaxID=50710 RepID=UPI002BEF66D5|nr:efflux RND transporter permease subunit [Acidocella sp.]HVE21374.1 efflux RND transporter permease subunit [Acidocella sp.]
MSRFFIDRPIFAWVLALVVMLAGAISILQLPISQYPMIAPTQISITTTYAGASAQTVADTVVRPILQQMTGLDGLEYVDATSESDGSMTIDLTFKQGTDPDIAQVQVQNKLSLAEATLPSEVLSAGLDVEKATKDYMMFFALVSTDGRMTHADIGDYIASNMEDPVASIPGVGDYTLFGSEYAMRIWLKPGQLYKYGLTVGDVANAIAAQNVTIPAGELGDLPANPGQRLDATMIGPSQFNTPAQFANILLKVEPSGAQVHLGDVAKIELGPQSYAINALFNGHPAAAMGLQLTPGANQLDVEKAVKAELSKLQARLPPGLKMVYPYDTQPYITLSLEEVFKTLLEAIALVFVVMLIFLQNFRATLIPTIAVPVVLLGTFGILSALGYSINTLTMLAMVLAVGLLVDDAIVVVENVDRLMHERGLPAKEAARQSMDEISSALIGIALVLSAVFLPMSFFGGSAGVIYRQFSITIVSAMGLSILTALIFTPALCATLLRPPAPGGLHDMRVFKWFNRGLDSTREGYLSGVGKMTKRRRVSMLGFLVITLAMVYLFSRVPAGFLPNEDQGLLLGQVTLPDGSTAEQTEKLNREVQQYVEKTESKNVQSVFTVSGFSFAGRAQSQGFLVLLMKPWADRPDPSQSVGAVAARVMQHFANSREGQVFLLQPPPVLELGNASGFDFELENIGNLSDADFYAARNKFLALAAKDPLLVAVRPNGLGEAPQYKLHVDREKASALGLSIGNVDTTIEGALASEYIDQFIRDGRVKDVYIQGEADARMQPSDLAKWYVRNNAGGMVPFDSFMTGSWTVGPQAVEIYNGDAAYEIQGEPAPGVSSGAAMAEIEKLAAEMPAGVGMEWTGISFEQVQAGSQTGALYGISVIFVLLCLAALYESWSIPVAVMLVVPLGIIGAVIANLVRGIDNDVYFQIGLLTTMGLAVKNAILIVEFARDFFEKGESLVEAALHAGRERLRPILMTSIAFICGTFPLAIATGAGAGARTAIGTAVVGGMVSATVLAVFFVPLFFVVVLTLTRVKRRSERNPVLTATAREH